jgi:hypothetical protein
MMRLMCEAVGNALGNSRPYRHNVAVTAGTYAHLLSDEGAALSDAFVGHG